MAFSDLSVGGAFHSFVLIAGNGLSRRFRNVLVGKSQQFVLQLIFFTLICLLFAEVLLDKQYLINMKDLNYLQY